ncbi:leucyl/phenylalanyl-tRNA--protein transferase [Psychromonas aquimarina]|uniref:leucyl/phenylalanyl-tRNA--protein transferase n=1 Tax=Psychromonas aquimarina TaxID=444919 RepID=UPI0004241AE0|nr:leucyl/phenylalanyl-tRNA--protein transferase [Psychromonas aquimarina]
MTIYITSLSPDNLDFPSVEQALTDPDGLLAMGGDLSCERLIEAYRHAVFPWFSEGQPLLWWSPKMRASINPKHPYISKSLKKLITRKTFQVSVNHAFNDVIHACSLPRAAQSETWITAAMIDAYKNLHRRGHAHSIEVWCEGRLVGGLYGICIGSVFCGESMFHTVSNASKIAFTALCAHFAEYGGKIIDCQMMTGHLQSLGVQENSRENFITQLKEYRDIIISPACWQKQFIKL